MAYAENTTVSPSKSREEIQGLLRRYGADSFAYGEEPGRAMVGFKWQGRTIRFVIPIPTDLKEFKRTPKGRVRADGDARKAMEGEERRIWRALGLCLKGKLEAVESNVVTFEDEFLAHTVLPNGQTVGESLTPMIDRAIEDNQMPNFGSLALGTGER